MPYPSDYERPSSTSRLPAGQINLFLLYLPSFISTHFAAPPSSAPVPFLLVPCPQRLTPKQLGEKLAEAKKVKNKTKKKTSKLPSVSRGHITGELWQTQ